MCRGRCPWSGIGVAGVSIHRRAAAAFSGVSTLFLLNAVTDDEFTQAIITLSAAREAGVERVVYVSVFYVDRTMNVPHFAVSGAEPMLRQMGFDATDVAADLLS